MAIIWFAVIINIMERKSKTLLKRQSNAPRVNFKESTFERNFITPQRAVAEFMLKPSQLEGLPKNYRRSPYESELSITVYNRKDVEKRALEVWGTHENLDIQRQRREQDKKIFDQYGYETKRTLREARRSAEAVIIIRKKRTREAIIIGLAITVDLLNFVFKFAVWVYTHSDSMLAESIHSAADMLNESILVIGILKSNQHANPRHPYGFSSMMYVVALIAGVGIFCIGGGVSAFKGIQSLIQQNDVIKISELKWAFIVLGFAFITELVSLVSTIIATIRGSREHKLGFFQYIERGIEPGVNVIFMEDSAAVVGTIIAACMLCITLETDNFIPDAVGSIVIGILLAVVALFLIISNAGALVGRSIPKEKLEHINNAIESDVMIRAIYDVKGIEMGNNLVRYKAEIDFDGAELTRLYLDRMNLNDLFKEVKEIENIDDLETFMVTHGEGIVDLMGGEIDRIELKIRSQFPEIRHVDLEIL